MEPALKSQDQIADTCDQLASAADGLLSQLPRKGGQQYRYFYGVLVRYRTMTHDIARLIRNNNTDHFTSVFALFRILLDDMIRVLTVWASNTPTEQLNQIDADAHRHRFESLRLRTEYTQEYANSDIGGKMKIKYDEEKAEFYANPKHARFFKNGTPLKFKKLGTISEALSDTQPKPGMDLKKLSELKVLYKELSAQVHYSTVIFAQERDMTRRSIEIALLEVIQIYLYKELRMHFSFFKEEHTDIAWHCPELDQWFNSAVVEK